MQNEGAKEDVNTGAEPSPAPEEQVTQEDVKEEDSDLIVSPPHG